MRKLAILAAIVATFFLFPQVLAVIVTVLIFVAVGGAILVGLFVGGSSPAPTYAPIYDDDDYTPNLYTPGFEPSDQAPDNPSYRRYDLVDSQAWSQGYQDGFRRRLPGSPQGGDYWDGHGLGGTIPTYPSMGGYAGPR